MAHGPTSVLPDFFSSRTSAFFSPENYLRGQLDQHSDMYQGKDTLAEKSDLFAFGGGEGGGGCCG